MRKINGISVFNLDDDNSFIKRDSTIKAEYLNFDDVSVTVDGSFDDVLQMTIAIIAAVAEALINKKSKYEALEMLDDIFDKGYRIALRKEFEEL